MASREALAPDWKDRGPLIANDRLEQWFDEGIQRLHCLPWEAEAGMRWAELLASLRTSGRAMPIKDSLIAATALVHGLTVATRNRTDFEKASVKIVDPFVVRRASTPPRAVASRRAGHPPS